MIVSVLINLILFSIIAYMSIDSKDKRREIRLLNRSIDSYKECLSKYYFYFYKIEELQKSISNYIFNLNEFDKTKGLNEKQQGLLQAYTKVKEIINENA